MEANRLLVVDDEPLMASVIGKVARTEGFDVIATDDAGDLRRRVRSWRPTALALDLRMPGLDGFEALGILREEGCTARILIISGGDPQMIGAARRLADEYGLRIAGILTKPFEIAELSGLLRAVLAEESAVNPGALGRALAEGELYLEYQPLIEVASRRPRGVEALMRWRHPQFGLLPPSAFLPLIEGSELARQLILWLFATALGQQRDWRAQGLDLEMAINFSARDFAVLDIADAIESCCAALDAPARGITLEVTESAAAVDPARIAAVAARLPGVRLAIDDLGTGYSSLLQLRRLPFRECKIDQAFVKECASAPASMTIVRAMIDLAHGLGQRVVAEGVETEETLRVLGAAGCDWAQGYRISASLAGGAVGAWVAAWTAREVGSLTTC